MEQAMQAGSVAGIVTIASILAIITMTLWIFIPFIIIGIRKRIDVSNELLRQIRNELETLNKPRG